MKMTCLILSVVAGVIVFTFLCGCKTNRMVTVMTPLEVHVREARKSWFLDISIIYESLVVCDPSDKNMCRLVFDFDTSWSTSLAHWIIYEPDRIVVMLEMTLNNSVNFPVEKYDRFTSIQIPNRQGRSIFLADETTERMVRETNLCLNRALPIDVVKQKDAVEDIFNNGSGIAEETE